MVDIVERVRGAFGVDEDDVDRVTLGEWLSTGGFGDDVNTGTPPPIGPGGSALASLGLRTRIAGALGWEAARSDIGQDVLEGAVDAPTGGDADSGGEGAGAWLARNLDVVGIVIVVLAVIVAVGQLVTFDVGVGN